MKTTRLVFLTTACAQFILSAIGASGPARGEKPPPLGFESTLQAPAGVQPSWTALKGKVVVLEFWATWCGPCIAAMAHLNELADNLKDQPIQFIAITEEDQKVVEPFLRKKPIHAWIGLDTDKSMSKDYGITGIPHTVVVDRDGIIAAITHPSYLTEKYLRDLLAGKKAALAQDETQSRFEPQQVPARSKPERANLFQVMIRPSEGGPSSSSSSRGGLTMSGATVLDILSLSFNINRARIVTSSALPQGRFDLAIKMPNTDNEKLKNWLQQAVESAFGVTARRETREMDAFVLKAGQLTEHLVPTGSTGTSSMSSGGGSLNCVNQSINSLAGSLEEMLNKPVLNETGLTNAYDFQLLWDETKSGPADPVELTRALHEQLGLNLAPAKKTVELLLVASRQSGKLTGQEIE
jgi:uncharacterized protein (TIGR03435 family)